MKFYATIRLEIRRAEQIKDGTNIIGNRVRIKVVKNKVAPPFKRAEVDIMYGKGISQSGELVDMAVEKDIINKSGSWYSYGEERIGQGRENAKTYLEEHQDMYDEVMKKVRAAYDIPDETDSDTSDDKASSDKKTDKKADKKDSKKESATGSSKETKTDSIDLDIGK